MEITVVSEEENPMLHRTDVTFRVSHVEATPDRLAVRDSLAARLNKDADEVVIRKLDTKFGMRTTYGEAKVYESPAEAKEVEQGYMLARNKIAVGEDGEVEADAAEEAGEPAVEEEAEEPEPEEAEEEAEPEDAEEDVEEAEDESGTDESEDDATAEEDVDEAEEESEPEGDGSDADEREDDATADAADEEETEE
jgi:small subunit ribosomal protein S24e